MDYPLKTWMVVRASSLSFRQRVFALVFALMIIQLITLGGSFHLVMRETVEHQVGSRALIQAKEIAVDTELIQEVRIKNVLAVERIADRLRKISDASYISIGDADGIRLSHPIKERIGLPMVGGDNEGVLKQGKSYVSFSEGSLGYSVRGKAAIIDFDGKIIGVVSVGYMINRFDEWIAYYLKPMMVDFIFLVGFTLIAAWLFSSHIKKKMYGMEPDEIAMALHLQKSILRSVYEGVIAIERSGKILTINNTACEFLDSGLTAQEMKHRSIMEFVSSTEFFFKTPLEENLKDEIVSINGRNVIANRVAIFRDDQLSGWVISFRDKNDINSLTAELAQIKLYTDNLRVMRHEHANKLSTIGGLIEIGDAGAALALINSESSRKQQLIDFLNANIKCKQVAGILLGKYARARELGLDLQFDPTCQLHKLSSVIDVNELSAVIGNLIDNAFEATLNNPDSSKVISILITDAGSELVIEVADNGTGVSPEIANNIFTRGITSKNNTDGHGIGLYLVNKYVTNAGGVILVDNAETKGTIFSIFIPN